MKNRAGQVKLQRRLPFGLDLWQGFFPLPAGNGEPQKTSIALVEVERMDAVSRGGVRVGTRRRDVPGHADFTVIGALKFGQQMINPSGKMLEIGRASSRA